MFTLFGYIIVVICETMKMGAVFLFVFPLCLFLFIQKKLCIFMCPVYFVQKSFHVSKSASCEDNYFCSGCGCHSHPL